MKTQQILGLIGDALKGKPAQARSSRWPAFRKANLAKECAACGSAAGLTLHHVIPFHIYPELELDPSNVVTLCEGSTCNCHLWIGHAGNFRKFFNRQVREDAQAFRDMLGRCRTKTNDDSQ